ncbi:MAG: ABC transporter permease [Trueperaceae bacterium]|nr:ABC transporter permease [Trueperaceae bacterium]
MAMPPAELGVPQARTARSRSAISALLRQFARSRTAVIGLVIFSVIVLVSVFAPFIATHPPQQIVPAERLQAPSRSHLLGTDNLGRDVFSRVVYGGRTSLSIAAVVVVITGVIGTALGLISGFYRRLDGVLMRFMDGLMAIPTLLLAIALIGVLGPNSVNLVIALSVVYVPRVARIARATTLQVRGLSYVEAARALGGLDRRLVFRHIAPNALGSINVQLTFVFAYAVLSEAALSFLGVGAPPEVPTWGNILSEGRAYMILSPWIAFYPGVAIMLTVLGLNLMGDGLRDLLDPRLVRGAGGGGG